MKANTILTRTNTYIEVESYKGEKRRIHLPKTIAKEAIYIVRGKIRMGGVPIQPQNRHLGKDQPHPPLPAEHRGGDSEYFFKVKSYNHDKTNHHSRISRPKDRSHF
jgi:hypothetical protein